MLLKIKNKKNVSTKVSSTSTCRTHSISPAEKGLGLLAFTIEASSDNWTNSRRLVIVCWENIF